MKKEIAVAICDDNATQISILKGFLNNYQCQYKFEVISTTSPDELINIMNKNNQKIEVALLDIEMGSFNGLELGILLKEKNEDVIVVYITGHKDYSFYSYEVKPLDYILKPVTELKFFSIMDDVIHRYEQIQLYKEKMNTFTIKTKELVLKINYKNIFYFEKSYRKIAVVTTQGKFSFYLSIKQLEQLLDMSQFVRAHQGYLVNKNNISAFHDNVLFLKDSSYSVPVSRKCRHFVIKSLEEILLD